MTTRLSNRFLGAIAILAVAGAVGCERKTDTTTGRTTDSTVATGTNRTAEPASGSSSAMTTNDTTTANTTSTTTHESTTSAAPATDSSAATSADVKPTPRHVKKPVTKTKTTPDSARRESVRHSTSGMTSPDVNRDRDTTYYFDDHARNTDADVDDDLVDDDATTSGMTTTSDDGFRTPWCRSKNPTIVDCPSHDRRTTADADFFDEDATASGMTSPDSNIDRDAPWCTSKNRTLVDCPAGWRDHVNE